MIGLAAGSPERDEERNGDAARLFAQLIRRARAGDPEAAELLYRLAHDELRRIAGNALDGYDAHSLQATMLVDDAFMKLINRDKSFAGSCHFLAVAATAMRNILVDHYRSKRRAKRPDARKRSGADPDEIGRADKGSKILEVHDALELFAKIDPRAARVVEMKFFGGMSHEAIADALGVDVRTVERDWRVAQTKLRKVLAP